MCELLFDIINYDNTPPKFNDTCSNKFTHIIMKKEQENKYILSVDDIQVCIDIS